MFALILLESPRLGQVGEGAWVVQGAHRLEDRWWGALLSSFSSLQHEREQIMTTNVWLTQVRALPAHTSGLLFPPFFFFCMCFSLFESPQERQKGLDLGILNNWI